jgi:Ribbon-helix-helix protein, copG family
MVGNMARSKATFHLDADVLRATRVRAARTGKPESDVVEEALREYLGLAVIDEIWAKADLDEDAAMRLAYEELHAMRRERRKAAE